MIIGLQHLHSGLRYVVLLFLVISIVVAFVGRNKGSFKGLKTVALVALASAHLQLVIGLALYFLKNWHLAFTVDGFMKAPHTRFFAVEHLTMMLLAIILITVGYASAKRMTDAVRQHRRILVFYLVALVLIFASIPWPFRTDLGHYGWF
ncbi:MAG: hypothetical protein ACFCUH_00310 [Flavobacteriales bacterium]|jgi:hypothetical protein